jgi:ubiquitin thioesterase protein OTUB1
MADEDDHYSSENDHRLTQAQLESIENEIKNNQPLTSNLFQIGILAQQYADSEQQHQNSGFKRGVQFLCTKYTSIRKVRGDGNCYYRAFLYALCEKLLSNNTSVEYYRIRRIVDESLAWVCQFGYEEYTIDMFHEELVDLFTFIDTSYSTSEYDSMQQQLHTRLNEQNATSDYCTWFMRVMTAAQMKSNPNRYLPYVMAEDYTDINTFCSREVEPMGKECGMVQVSALAECLGVRVIVEYMDGHMGPEMSSLVHHVFGGEEVVDEDVGDNKMNDSAQSTNGEEERTSIVLLYRPGHYDILY